MSWHSSFYIVWNLFNYGRSSLALKLKPVFAERAKENERLGGKGSQKSVNHKTDTQKELAKIASVSHDTIAGRGKP